MKLPLLPSPPLSPVGPLVILHQNKTVAKNKTDRRQDLSLGKLNAANGFVGDDEAQIACLLLVDISVCQFIKGRTGGEGKGETDIHNT